MLVHQSHLSLGTPVDCSPPGPSASGSLQARVLEWAFPSAGAFPTQGLNPHLLHCRGVLYHLSHQDRWSELTLIPGSPGHTGGSGGRWTGQCGGGGRQWAPVSRATPSLLIRCPQPSLTAHQLCQGQTAPRHPALVRSLCDPAHTTSGYASALEELPLNRPPAPPTLISKFSCRVGMKAFSSSSQVWLSSDSMRPRSFQRWRPRRRSTCAPGPRKERSAAPLCHPLGALPANWGGGQEPSGDPGSQKPHLRRPGGEP